MLAVPGVASVNRYHFRMPRVGLRPIARPSSEISARTAVTTVSPSGSATYTVTGDFTAKRAAVNESLAKLLGLHPKGARELPLVEVAWVVTQVIPFRSITLLVGL